MLRVGDLGVAWRIAEEAGIEELDPLDRRRRPGRTEGEERTAGGDAGCIEVRLGVERERFDTTAQRFCQKASTPEAPGKRPAMPMMAIRRLLRREGPAAPRGHGGRIFALAWLQEVGQSADRRITEQVDQGDLAAELFGDARLNLDQQERMATQLEEMVVRSDLSVTEELGPDPGEDLFGWRPRCQMAPRRALPLRSRQGLTVHLAIRGEGERCERHEGGRHHVVRQPLSQQLSERVGVGVANHIGDQPPVARRVLARYDDRRADSGELDQHRLDFLELDAEAPNLDLMVQAAQELQVTVRQVAAEVAGAVETIPGPRGEGVRHKAFGRQIGTAEIAPRQTSAAQAQLTRRSRRHRPQGSIEEEHLVACQGASDGGAGGARLDAMEGGIHRALGRTVEVETSRTLRLGKTPPEGLIHRLSRSEHDARTGRAVEQSRVHQETEL